ncbi:pyrophosphatase PpaX [Sporosarcina sp. ANT_H38]|uniref:pyrophosphatase PpaX n=1 Tax=Sporosarcina sp. ANT_H38 TaxID=2597358 RepID=UPI0011F390E6|nr:pyrophosphatase PpaX [Sporosarcina sp. ANT_H38]KAA0944321.1 pyrophosphatase PpaX [Sporosarcina sp. ANT_H38]
MAKPITTLLFDFDGTLLDTNELIIQTFQHVLGNHYPGKYDRIDILPFLGPTLHESFGSIDIEKTEQLIDEYRLWNKSMHDELSIEFDGVSETMKLLKAAGMKMAIVSTKRKDMVMLGLELLDVEGVFDEIIARDDVTKTKPDPEPILLALERLGVTADEALMIGDNYHDIEGGQNAGVRTAGVAWSAKGEAFLQTFNPDYMLQHISDLLHIVKGEKG